MIVTDASVALKLFKDEAGSDAARALLLREPLVAPELILPEVLNAGWKAVRLGLMVPAQLEAMAVELASCFARLAGLVPLAATAARTALEIDHPVYDCFYLALAELELAQLVTADARLVAKTRGTRRAQQVVMLDVS